MTSTRRSIGMFLRLVIVLALAVAATGIAEACPGCKESLFDPAELPQRLSLAKGYAWTIGLLLSVPALLISGVVLSIARTHRRLLKQNPE